VVDALSLEGAPVLADIASGTDLSSLDPAQYRALRLRVRLSSGAVGETPALDRWQLTWKVATQKLYLPVAAK